MTSRLVGLEVKSQRKYGNSILYRGVLTTMRPVRLQKMQGDASSTDTAEVSVELAAAVYYVSPKLNIIIRCPEEVI